MGILKLLTTLPKTLKSEHASVGAFSENVRKMYNREGATGIVRAIFRTFRTTKQYANPDRDTYYDNGIIEKLANLNFNFSRRDKAGRQYFQQLFQQTQKDQPESVPISRSCLQLDPEDPKIIAFYLPQFHPFPENDEWWGKGFTEWTNVSKAVPQFLGHYQPKLPGELGFYDLRLKEIQERQIELAKQYGIYGFCYHHYWFAGKRLMDMPANRLINGEMRFPFCLCWANENWTRRWDGAEQEILISQVHSPEDDLAFIEDIAPALQNKLYIRVEGKPLLIVYRVNLLPDAKATAKRWRDYCRTSGIGEIYLVAAQAFDCQELAQYGFDASVEFPPHKFHATFLNHTVDFANKDFKGKIYDYADIVRESDSLEETESQVYHTVMPSWDNEARIPGRGNVYHNARPALYQRWLTNICRHVKKQSTNRENLVFINAWNEWAEGAYLEPDRRYGYAYLQATSNAILTTRSASEKTPLISIIVPAYNHEKFIYSSLQSIANQTYNNIETIIIDDGSTDNTGSEVKRFIANHPDMAISYNFRDNNGSRSAIKKGITKAKGAYIAILNSDDLYEPERFDFLLNALKEKNSCLAFSNVSLIDETGEDLSSPNDKYVLNIKNKITNIENYHNIVYALLDSNVAVSSGNLFFSRWLYDALGGFSDHKFVHDWSFILRATFYAEPVYVKDKLYKYRIHQTNTYKKLDALAVTETNSVLGDFFSRYKTNFALFNNNFDEKIFNDFIEQRGYRKFIKC